MTSLLGFIAVENVLQVIHDQAIPTYDANGNVVSFYNIVRVHDSVHHAALISIAPERPESTVHEE